MGKKKKKAWHMPRTEGSMSGDEKGTGEGWKSCRAYLTGPLGPG